MSLTMRRGYGGRRLFWNGKHVGEVFKFNRAPGYGLRLIGVYWNRDGGCSLKGGGSTAGFKLMRDAIAKAESVLGHLGKLRTEL